jgi:hypothetical protein
MFWEIVRSGPNASDNSYRRLFHGAGFLKGKGMQKSAIEEIKELKAQLATKTEQAKTEALKNATAAINALRELGIDINVILKDLELKSDTKAKAKEKHKVMSCRICNFKTDPPHDGRTHRGQTKKKPLTAGELEKKGLTKV